MEVNRANRAESGWTANHRVPPAGPPPLPASASYYIALGGQQAGPFESGMLKDKVTAGQVTRETLVWKQGMPQWTAAGLVAELKGLFENSPPPLPPQG